MQDAVNNINGDKFFEAGHDDTQLDAYGRVVKTQEPVLVAWESKAMQENPRGEMLKLGNNLVFLTD